jgi:hypothetical protein
MNHSKVLVKHRNNIKKFDSLSKALMFLKNNKLNIYDKYCKFYPFNNKKKCFDLKNPIQLFPVAKTYKPFFSPYLSKKDYFNTEPITFNEDTNYQHQYDDTSLFDEGDESLYNNLDMNYTSEDEDCLINDTLVDY